MNRFKKYETVLYKEFSKLETKIEKIEEDLEKFEKKVVLAPYQKYFNFYSEMVSV